MAARPADIERRVLRREDFGLCVGWPKTHWKHLGGPGETDDVLVNGMPTQVTIQAERCNCQGAGWHVHRFLSLPEEAGVRQGERVTIGVSQRASVAEPDAVGLTVTAAVDEVNDALLFGKALSAQRSERLGRFLAGRQGLEGSYAGMFAAVGDELSEGYRIYTGERMRSGGGARHILGEEALHALIMLERQGGTETGVDLMRAAIERASGEMTGRLARQRQPGSTERLGFYCCHTCTVALWRTLAAGGLGDGTDALLSGLAGLRDRRTGDGAWHGFPFSYTLLTLIGTDLDEARAEMVYARPALEQRLGRRGGQDAYALRRHAVFERALELVG